MFFNKKIDIPLEISSDSENISSLLLQRSNQIESSVFSNPMEVQKNDIQLNNIYPLKITHKINKKEFIGLYYIVMNSINMQWNVPIQGLNFPEVSYVDLSQDNIDDISRDFGIVIKKGRQQQIIDILKVIEPDLENISVIPEDLPRIYIQKKGSPFLPLAVMGSGIGRLIRIICSIIIHSNGIILIDEINTGLHYTFLPKLWSIIEELSETENVQIFATTHSYECIQDAFLSIKNKDIFSYIRIDKEENDIISYNYSSEDLEYAFRKLREIR